MSIDRVERLLKLQGQLVTYLMAIPSPLGTQSGRSSRLWKQ